MYVYLKLPCMCLEKLLPGGFNRIWLVPWRQKDWYLSSSSDEMNTDKLGWIISSCPTSKSLNLKIITSSCSNMQMLLGCSFWQTCQRATYTQQGRLSALIKKADSWVIHLSPGAWWWVFEGAHWGSDVREDNKNQRAWYKGWLGQADAQTTGALLISKHTSRSSWTRLTQHVSNV